MSSIFVLGSMNMDFVVYCHRHPRPGETLLGKSWQQFPGGKGANQALAAARLGMKTHFFGACGQDPYGTELLAHLKKGAVHTEQVLRRKEPTGAAFITVDEGGENRIVVVPGANGALQPEDVEAVDFHGEEVSLLLLQLEVPLETVEAAIEIANDLSIPVFLDPAPGQILPREILQGVTCLLPNEEELMALAEGKSNEERAEALLEQGTGSVLLTRGEKGAVLYHRGGCKAYPAYAVQSVDSTAAGDAFAAAYASATLWGWEVDGAIDFACAAGALTTTVAGAQSSLPSREVVEQFMKEARHYAVDY